MPDNRNFLLAIVLSIGVLLLWQFFIAGPQTEKLRQEQELAAQQTTTETTNPGATATTTTTGAAGQAATTAVAPGAVGAAATTRDAALAESARVPIETGALSGSISLAGGRIDDLRLLAFHETADTSSPTIVLLSPVGSPIVPADLTHSLDAQGPYFAEFGWIGTAGGPLPGPDTKWTAPSGAKLSTATPVELTYDNGAGLVFTRKIAVDDKYMFTVTDTVANSGTTSASLTPYGRVTRLGDPSNGSYILHLGLIGAVGDQHLKQEDYKSLQSDKTVAFDKANSGWFGINDKYWATALVPEPGKDFTAKFVRIDTPGG